VSIRLLYSVLLLLYWYLSVPSGTTLAQKPLLN